MRSSGFLTQMSPREKHVPDMAQRTSVCLTTEDKAAVRWVSDTRRIQRNRRTTLNDILVDALWYLLEKEYGKTKQEIQSMVPQLPAAEPLATKVREMPKPKKKA